MPDIGKVDVTIVNTTKLSDGSFEVASLSGTKYHVPKDSGLAESQLAPGTKAEFSVEVLSAGEMPAGYRPKVVAVKDLVTPAQVVKAAAPIKSDSGELGRKKK